MSPLVSVIIPTKNSARCLERCLASIKNQSYKNIELIVVDNSSSDQTKQIAEKFTDKVLNRGPERSAQRNFGVKNSMGSYIAIVDSDMILSQKVVENCLLKIETKDGISGIIIPEESIGQGFWARCKKLERSFYPGIDWMEGARFFRKNDFLCAGGYDETMVSGEDWDLSSRIEEKGSLERIDDLIYHDEGRIRLFQTIKKKLFYAGKFTNYASKNKLSEKFKKQTSILCRYKLFFSKPAKLLKNPLIGCGMIFMKTCEFGFGGLGYLLIKLNMKNYLKNLYQKAEKTNERNIFNLLEKNAEAKLLDLGCDNGSLTLKIAQTVGTADIYGIEVIKERGLMAEKLGINVRLGNLDEKWPFDNNSFDVVTGNQVIEHVSDIDHFASEIYRVLKPGGYAIISTENASSWHNIFASIMGWQIFSLTALSKRKSGIGNPLAFYRDGKQSLGWTHKVIFNYLGLKEFLEIYDFKVEKYLGAGYYPFSFLSRFDARHSHFITIKIRK